MQHLLIWGIKSNQCNAKRSTISSDAANKVRTICSAAAGKADTGNGRFCRNLVESAVLNYALRVYGDEEISESVDFVLLEEDFIVPELKQSKEKKQRIIGFRAS